MRHCVFDIETGPLPANEIDGFMPEFDAPGNYKDEAKIAAYIADKQAEWRGKAALSALTGQVLCVGILYSDGQQDLLHDIDEATTLRLFWATWLDYTIADHWIGFNIFEFDLPFLVRRSIIKNVTVPDTVRKHRFFHDRFIDLMDRWKMNTGERVSLNNLCRACGMGEKAGNGADFAGLWISDRSKAMDYVTQDLTLTASLAKRMGYTWK